MNIALESQPYYLQFCEDLSHIPGRNELCPVNYAMKALIAGQAAPVIVRTAEVFRTTSGEQKGFRYFQRTNVSNVEQSKALIEVNILPESMEDEKVIDRLREVFDTSQPGFKIVGDITDRQTLSYKINDFLDRYKNDQNKRLIENLVIQALIRFMILVNPPPNPPDPQKPTNYDMHFEFVLDKGINNIKDMGRLLTVNITEHGATENLKPKKKVARRFIENFWVNIHFGDYGKNPWISEMSDLYKCYLSKDDFREIKDLDDKKLTQMWRDLCTQGFIKAGRLSGKFNQYGIATDKIFKKEQEFKNILSKYGIQDPIQDAIIVQIKKEIENFNADRLHDLLEILLPGFTPEGRNVKSRYAGKWDITVEGQVKGKFKDNNSNCQGNSCGFNTEMGINAWSDFIEQGGTEEELDEFLQIMSMLDLASCGRRYRAEMIARIIRGQTEQHPDRKDDLLFEFLCQFRPKKYVRQVLNMRPGIMGKFDDLKEEYDRLLREKFNSRGWRITRTGFGVVAKIIKEILL